MTFKEALNRLHRSKTQKVFGGVCGGIAATTDTPPWVWRAGFLFALLWLGSGGLLYIVLWITMPEEPGSGG